MVPMFDNSPPDQDDYDPREQRVPKGPISLLMAYFNLIKAAFGPGVLAIPVAISQTGMVFGPILGAFFGALLIHMHIVLLNCLNEICRKFRIPHISYRYGFRVALLHGPDIIHDIGKHGPAIIATFMLLTQIGICCVFIDLTSDSVRDMMDWQSSRPAIFWLLVPYLLLEYFMKSLKIVSYISMIGNVLNLLGIILILYLVFLEQHGELEAVKIESVQFYFALGIFLFNSSAVGVILSLDRALAQPKLLIKKFGIISIGMGVPTVFGIIFGLLVYRSFGTLEENCLRFLPYDDDVSMAVLGMFLISVAFSYPIQSYPAVQILVEIFKYHDPYQEPPEKTLKFVEKIARPMFVLLTFFISYWVPLQTPFVAFVGCLCTTMLSLTFPALMELCLMYPGPYGKYNIYLIKDLTIVVLGIMSWIGGVAHVAYLIYIKILCLPAINDNEYF